MEFMDIDGPEFLLSVNNEIANIRAGSYERNDSVNANIFDNSFGPVGRCRTSLIIIPLNC